MFANGDIEDLASARKVLDQTRADGVMIGRAALGAPWLPGQIAGVCGRLSVPEKLSIIREHLQAGHLFYGEPGVRIMRKHLQWYFEKLSELESESWRKAQIRLFNRLTSAQEQLDFLDALLPAVAA